MLCALMFQDPTDSQHDLFLDIEQRKSFIKSKMSQIQTESEGKVFQCLECNYTSKISTNMKDHIEAKHLYSRIACSLCDLTFSTISYLTKHMKRNHYQ